MEGSAMNIGLLGATLESLLLALELRKHEHEVFLFEIDAELGMPVQYPGWLIDLEVLGNWLSKEQRDFLTLHENDHGWAFRMEWAMKFLSHQATKKGVNCFPRTRVLNTTSNPKGFKVDLTAGERSFPSEVVLNRIVDFTKFGGSRPGGLEHQVKPEHRIEYRSEPLQSWYGALLLQADAKQAPNAALELHRSDGLAELWWAEKPSWVPKRGFVETYEANLPDSLEDLTFDAAVGRVRSFLQKLV